ncbi:MAG TPA: DUF1569 domain-containing protein [Bacteroidota bacterium]|nr:DUF1569 domain-containing protein [Bacteroidota bacterium]
MKTLFDKSVSGEILGRINCLQPEGKRLWGKMTVPQMLAHCSIAMEMANGSKVPPRTVLGLLIGRLIKPSVLGEKPLPRNSPTDKTFIISDTREFTREQQRLVQLVKEFAEGGESKCTRHIHAFFGPLTPGEWGILTYKHLDHHLRQFGV